MPSAWWPASWVVVGTLWSVFSTLIVPRSNTSHLLRAVAEVITGVARPMRRRLPHL